jgi:hypothetical protein
MGTIFLIFGILICIVGIVGIIFSIVDRDIVLIIEPILITILGVLLIVGSFSRGTKKEYEVTHIEHLEQDDVRITIKRDGVSFWIIMNEEDYNNETTLNLSPDEISEYPNSKNKNV